MSLELGKLIIAVVLCFGILGCIMTVFYWIYKLISKKMELK